MHGMLTNHIRFTARVDERERNANFDKQFGYEGFMRTDFSLCRKSVETDGK